MSWRFQIGLIAVLGVAGPAWGAPAVHQLHAVQDLEGVQPGSALDVRVRGRSKAKAAEAAGEWSLVIGACGALGDAAPQRARGGVFRLTVPAVKRGDPYVCVARVEGGRVMDDPLPLRFCVGDLTLRECHPGWWDGHCVGVSAAECDRRAIAAGVKAGDEPSGLLYVDAGGRSRKVVASGGSGCPVAVEGWGVAVARKGALMRLDVAARRLVWVAGAPRWARFVSPWPDGEGGVWVVQAAASGGELVRLGAGCARGGDCGAERVRVLPAGVGRIVGRSGDALLMTHRLSRHAVRVPLDAKRRVEQLSIAAPVGDCAVEVGGVRVRNSAVTSFGGR